MMKNKVFILFLVVVLLVSLNHGFTSNAKGLKATIVIGGKSYDVVYEDNATTKKLLKKFPVTYKMSELNGNEIYKYLDYDLPANEKKVKQINAGDVMLYGTDCIVIFYKSFKTDYSYTYLGHISDKTGLDKIGDNSSVEVTYKKVNNNTTSQKKSKTKKLKLSKTSLSLSVSKTATIKIKGSYKIKVKPSKKKYVKVTVKGKKIKIKGLKKGSVKLTVKGYKDGKLKAKNTIKVKIVK